MKTAIEEAQIGRQEQGVPIGSVLVKNGKIVGRGRNKRVQDGDPTAHAEIDCLRNVGRLGDYSDTVLYSTLMPCFMCAGAILQFGIPKVVAGEDRARKRSKSLLISEGVEVVDLDLDLCFQLIRDFATRHPEIWNEDERIKD